jgi:hypothetical protein
MSSAQDSGHKLQSKGTRMLISWSVEKLRRIGMIQDVIADSQADIQKQIEQLMQGCSSRAAYRAVHVVHWMPRLPVAPGSKARRARPHRITR